MSSFLLPALRRLSVTNLARNVSWLVADQVVRLALGVIISAILARYLGPTRLGALNYAASFAALFTAVATLGLDTIVVRDIVRSRNDSAEILGSAFMLRMVGSAVAFSSALITIHLLRPGDQLMHWLVGLSAGGMLIRSFDVISLWYQSQVQAKYAVLAGLAAYVSMSVGRLFLIWVRAPLILFAWASLAEAAIGVGALVAIYHGTGNHVRAWRRSATRAANLVRESWPLLLSGAAVMVYMRIDVIMLGAMLGDEAVGIYSVATRISELWYFVPTAIVSSVAPSIIKAKMVDDFLCYARLQSLFRVLAAIAVAIAVPLTFLATPLVDIWFGKAYTPAGRILTTHIWAAVFVFLGVAQSVWDTAEGLQRLALVRTIGGAAINIALNVLLIPLLGGLGAAIATVVSQAFSAVLSNALHPRTQRILVMQLKALVLFRSF